MEASDYPRVSEKEVKCLADDGILFLGSGSNPDLAICLDPFYKVSCVDIKSKPTIKGSELDWIQEDVYKLSFDEFKKDFDTVVLQRLCDGKGKMPLELILKGSLVGFENIIIEFCNNEEHYPTKSRDVMQRNALLCEQHLQEAGYNVRLLSFENEYLNFKLFASLSKQPSMPLKPKPEPVTGFFDPGFPPWYLGDGNHYD